MKYTVYHAKNPNFGFTEHPEFNEVNFDKVAEVEAEQIDKAYCLTNHILKVWWKNAGVVCFNQSRSTSVGDVMVDADGKKFRCEMVGWEEFT
jgi:hypothetical protein